MNFCFRVDIGSRVGDGHLFRCKAIAQYLTSIGNKNINFVVRPYDLLNSNKFHPFNSTFLDIDAGHIASDIDDARECLALDIATSPTIWIVDHYGLSKEWERAMRNAGHFVIAIDDLGRRHSANVILDQNISSGEKDYTESIEANQDLVVLAGPEYSLLQDSLRKLKINKTVLNFNLDKKTVLVFLGTARTEQFLKVLLATNKLSQLADFKFLNPPDELVEKGMIGSHQILPFQANIVNAYLDVDLVIGACGVSQMERFYLGIPTICLRIVENQKANGDYIEQENLSPYLGNLDDLETDVLENKLKNLIQLNQDSWSNYLKRTEHLINKDGVKKLELITSLITNNEVFDIENVNLALGAEKDVKYFYDLRNSLSARKWSEKNFETSYCQHIDWYYNKIEKSDYIFAIINYRDSRIGYIRLDEKNNISIAIEPPFTGRGAATKALTLFKTFVTDTKLRTKGEAINAIVMKNNLASYKIFTKAGYSLIHEAPERMMLSQLLE